MQNQLQYEKWRNNYFTHLQDIYKIFKNEFQNIKQLKKIDWDSADIFNQFCILIYNNSSKHIDTYYKNTHISQYNSFLYELNYNG